MKPIIIIAAPGADGALTITKEELEQYIEKAYREGYADGKAAGSPIYPCVPQIVPSPTTPYVTWDPDWGKAPTTTWDPAWDWSKVTCKS